MRPHTAFSKHRLTCHQQAQNHTSLKKRKDTARTHEFSEASGVRPNRAQLFTHGDIYFSLWTTRTRPGAHRSPGAASNFFIYSEMDTRNSTFPHS